ncbi:MAG: 30S ribosomal protein S4 [Candidatus Altiarchaeota archaeon]|nr:30S ribosomal protein S4 [Candidatus Altiarchaeota archaeon]
MGDPRRQRRKYTRPTHLWRTDRIEEENAIINKYGLKSKTEIWRARAALTRIRNQAVRLLGLSGEEAERDKSELIDRLIKSGMLKTSALDAVLALNVEDLFERRLQTIVYRRDSPRHPSRHGRLSRTGTS